MTRRWLVLGAFFGARGGGRRPDAGYAGAAPGALRAGDIVLRGGWVFDATGDQAVRNTGIVVRNGALLEVGAAGSARRFRIAVEL
jgi:hypothetical protein